MAIFQSNERLAGDYFRSVAQYAADIRSYLRVRETIAEAPIDLRAHFLEHGSLRSCKLPGLGRKTLDLLERFLREGVAQVSAGIQAGREGAVRPKPGRPQAESEIPGDISEPGAVDNAIRAIERDGD